MKSSKELAKEMSRIRKKILAHKEWNGRKLHHAEHILAQSMSSNTKLGYDLINYIKKKQERQTILMIEEEGKK